ncbi:MAG: sensor histidine kinase [Nocardioides sp.]
MRTGTDEAARRAATDLAATGANAPSIPSSPGAALVQVTDRSQKVVASSPAIDGEPLAFRVEVAPPGTRPVLSTVAVAALDGATYRVAAVATSTGGYDVYVALPLAEVDQSTAQLAGTLAVGVPVLAVAFAALTWIFAGRALRPVESLRRQADDISLTDLHRRLEVPGTGDELQALGTTLNDLLQRLDESLTRQRQFVADAAHELRSPVAAIRSQSEVADHVSGASAPSVLSMESVRLTQLVDDLLALARIDAEPHHRRERLDLDEIVLSEIALVRPSAAVILDASGVSAAQVRGDPGQLARTVRNVLDNAVRYADERVTISLRTRSPHAELVIEDDGPGIPAADRDRVRERFTRLDDARTRSIGGVGLGLAIVDEVVELHGGQLHIEDAGPGARIVITLPLADGAD